jgi:hypothetical protein
MTGREVKISESAMWVTRLGMHRVPCPEVVLWRVFAVGQAAREHAQPASPRTPLTPIDPPPPN